MGVGVMGSRGGFRMILHGKEWKLFVANAFDGSVVQIEVGDLQARRTRHPVRLASNREPVVL